MDFIVPSLFRTYLRELVLGDGGRGEALGGFKAHCSLVLDCPPLLRAASSWQPRSGASEPSGRARAQSKVLKGGAVRKLRRAKQLVLEVGEANLRDDCAWRSEEGVVATASRLEFTLTEEFSWWIRSGEGRLRVRLMPEKKASFLGREGSLSAAIRASRPRLFFQMATRGERIVGDFRNLDKVSFLEVLDKGVAYSVSEESLGNVAGVKTTEWDLSSFMLGGFLGWIFKSLLSFIPDKVAFPNYSSSCSINSEASFGKSL